MCMYPDTDVPHMIPGIRVPFRPLTLLLTVPSLPSYPTSEYQYDDEAGNDTRWVGSPRNCAR